MPHGHSASHAHETDGIVIHGAGFYDLMLRVFTLGREARLRERTVALAELGPEARVLDVGCGTGTLAIAAAQAGTGIEVSGIDPAVEMVERARQKAAAAGVKATFDVGVVEKLEAADESFDVVLSSLMLHHLPVETLRAGLREALRVLEPGGRLVVVDFPGPGPTLHRIGAVFLRSKRHAKRHVDQVQSEARAAGFVDLELGKLRPGPLFSLVAMKPK